MKVLVTGAGALLGQGIIRSLQAPELDVELVAVDPSPLSAGLYWAPKRYLVPMASDLEYLEAIESVLRTEHPDAVLVGTDVELKVFAAHRERLEAQFGTQIVVARPQAIAIADDKHLTCQFLSEHGFWPPETRLAAQAEQLVSRCGFPLVVKPRIGARSVGFSVVWNEQELADALKREDGLIVQEHIPDDVGEFTAGTITFDGSCDASIVMRRDLRDGNTYRAFVVKDPKIDQQVRAMAEALDAYGPANFQFRVADEQVRVFEINCRFSGTTPLRALAGFNEVDMVLRRAIKNEPVVQPEIKDLTILRYWNETALTPEQVIT